MADLKKIVKLTSEQYQILADGGTVGSYTGLNPEFMYLTPADGSGVASAVKTTNNITLSFWVGTQEEYDAIQEKDSNTFYIIVEGATGE